MKNKNKQSNKYSLGSFVTKNQQSINNIAGGVGALAPLAGDNVIGGALSGFSTGASIGSVIPGAGTLIGGAVGLVGGAISGVIGAGKRKRAIKKANKDANDLRHAEVTDQLESEIDYDNENPYGVYERGGDVNSELINIEKGELQVDPSTGKILREYKGINPETGGKYEFHNKKGKDTKHNMVTAEVDSFIITKKEADKYKKAVENNDKLSQNTTMANIRNAKKDYSKKFNDGGTVTRDYYSDWFNKGALQGVRPSLTGVTSPYINPSEINPSINPIKPYVSNHSGVGNTVSNIANTALNYLPAITNIAQSRNTPNYLEYKPTMMNVGLRQSTLANLPTEVNIHPVLNSINSSVNSIDKDILTSTSNSAISRALRQANAVSGRRAINEAYVNNANVNNNIRMNRSNVYSNLSAQDQQRSSQNASMALNVDNTNRQMDLAKQQQFNYGISQIQQIAQALKGNKLKGNREMEMIELMKQIFPGATDFLNNYKGGKNG